MSSLTPIRLTYLIDNLRLAGTQTALLHLVRGLSTRGYQQRVYYFNDKHTPNHTQTLRAAGATVTLLTRTPAHTPIGILRFARALRTHRPHIVQTFLPISDLIGRATARAARVPAIVTSIRARNVDKSALQFWLDRRTMKWADKVVFNAKSVIDFAIANEGVRPDQVVHIPNGVAIPAGGHSRARGDGAGQPIIGTVGRLRPQKDTRTLIEAFARVRVRVPAQLWIIGDGELRGELAGLATRLGVADHVRFFGTRTDTTDLLAQMDVYAHAAIFEGMPNAVMEAMAVGLPVVATAIDGTRELIQDGVTGSLAPSGDVSLIAEKILGVLENERAARAMGSAAHQHMRENYSIEKMVGAFDQLYRSLMRGTLYEPEPR